MHAEDTIKDAAKRTRDCEENTGSEQDDSSGQGKQESWREMVVVLVQDALTRLPQSVVFPVYLLIIPCCTGAVRDSVSQNCRPLALSSVSIPSIYIQSGLFCAIAYMMLVA